jgi:hypothetical protein
MKKVIALDEKLKPLVDEENKPNDLPTLREIFRMIGNVKADTADESRRSVRIINKLRDNKMPELLLENDDMNFLKKLFEKNPMNLTAWAQGQILDLIESAESMAPLKVV